MHPSFYASVVQSTLRSTGHLSEPSKSMSDWCCLLQGCYFFDSLKLPDFSLIFPWYFPCPFYWTKQFFLLLSSSVLNVSLGIWAILKGKNFLPKKQILSFKISFQLGKKCDRITLSVYPFPLNNIRIFSEDCHSHYFFYFLTCPFFSSAFQMSLTNHKFSPTFPRHKSHCISDRGTPVLVLFLDLPSRLRTGW